MTRERELERKVRRPEAQVAYLKKSIALKAGLRFRTASATCTQLDNPPSDISDINIHLTAYWNAAPMVAYRRYCPSRSSPPARAFRALPFAGGSHLLARERHAPAQA